MLTDDYLKYSPEITLEIFTLIYNKLIESGLKPVHTLGSAWREFSGRYSYLYCYNDKKLNQFNEPPKNGREITVQEILGYNPFVKDGFVLPKKWYLRTTPETDNILCEWRGCKHSSGYDSILVFNPESEWSICWENSDNIHKYSEITFEQFKKYVLKESIETSKETIPEYVECINVATCNTKVGEIFKCRQIDNSFEWEYNNKTIKNYSSWDGWRVPWSDKLPQKHFKPSTKEAFDAQNQPKQPLKQAVHCTTQEEWDFVSDKIGYKFTTKFELRVNDTINPALQSCECKSFYERRGEYQLLSFQKWCNLNGYKMEKEVKFEVGKWYYFESYDSKVPNIVRCDELISNSFKSNNWVMVYNHVQKPLFGAWNFNYIHNSKELSIEEVQQYLPEGHPDKLPLKKEKMILNENLIGKLVSLTYDRKFYTEVLVTKEYNTIYLLNNNYSNNNEHSDKSVYKYSLKFSSFDIANRNCSNIKLIEKSLDKQSDSNQEFKVGDIVVNLEVSISYSRNEICRVSKINKTHLACENKPQYEFSMKPFKCFRYATPEEINNYLNSIEQILVNNTDTKLIEDDFKLDYLPE